MQQSLFVSPAAAGIEPEIYVHALHRSQWAGYNNFSLGENAPASQLQLITASLHPGDSAAGVGLMVYRDKTGPLQIYNAKISYAYHLPYCTKGTIGVGIGAGIYSKTIDYNEYIIKHPDDPLLEEGNVTQLEPDLSLGIWVKHAKYYLGGSYAHFLKYDYDKINIPDEELITITGGYYFQTNADWKISPGFLLQNEASQTTITFHAIGIYQDLFEGGVAYRHEEAISVIAAAWLLSDRSLRLGLTTDLITQNREAKSKASFEVMIGYRFFN